MPMYYQKNKNSFFPSAKKLSETGLSLPSGPNLRKIDIGKISDLIKNYLYKINTRKTRP